MKNYLTYVLCAILLVSLGSCSKNENGPNDVDLLIGTWDVTRAIDRVFIDGKKADEYDTNNPNDEYTFDAQFTFLNNGTVRLVGDDVEGSLTKDYSLSNGGRTLSIHDFEEGFEGIEIKKLTTTDLELFLHLEEIDEGKKYRYELELFLKKAK